MMTNGEVLKQSLLNMYADDPVLSERINQICFANLAEVYYAFLYQHIDPETFNRVYTYMCSEEVAKYYEAIHKATEVVVSGVEDVLEFVEQVKPKNKEKYN